MILMLLLATLFLTLALGTGPIVKLSVRSGFYFNTGNYATPTWTPCTIMGDTAIDAQYDEQDASVKGLKVKRSEPTLLGLSVSGKIRDDDSNAQYISMETAYTGQTSLDLLILDESINTNGARGYRADWKVFKFSEAQPVNGIQWIDFEIKPAIGAGDSVCYVTVTGGTPTYTSID